VIIRPAQAKALMMPPVCARLIAPRDGCSHGMTVAPITADRHSFQHAGGCVMAEKKELLRQMKSELERFFEARFGSVNWSPEIEVFERDNRLVTRVDLPGLKKEDVQVEVTDGHLAISGERKEETEEKKDNVYRCERSYGSFYRAVPLPEGAKLEDVKAPFADGVLEVSVPLPVKAEVKPRAVKIDDGGKPATSAAA
jgi:HSP20 family protein